MENDLFARRFDAVRALQKIRDRYHPGSFEHEVADHAINLALNSRRSPTHRLLRNCLRDSRRILVRQRKSTPTLISLDEIIADGERGEYDPLTLHDLCAGTHPTPFELCAAQDFGDRLLERVSDSTPATAALHTMLESDSANRFSQRSGLSPSYFKKLKQFIRREAASLNTHGVQLTRRHKIKR
jgi:hypothetical protein